MAGNHLGREPEKPPTVCALTARRPWFGRDSSICERNRKEKGLSVRILRPLNWFHSLHGTQMVMARDPRTLLTAVFDHLTLNHGEWALWFTQYQRGEEQETMFTQ